ncbi:MAG: SDR family oxidoreductase [Myxococcota bacterium]|nr:SDR family oxidoreductase [Myxococcota bacterium]
MRLKNKVIIVTGASEGIGRALCLALAKQTTQLVLAARNKDRLEALKAEVLSLGSEALVVPTDLTDIQACQALVNETIAKWGRIDVLVNNAGATMWVPVDDIEDPSIFENLMRLNYLGAAHTTYYALPFIKKTKGRVVGVSSVAGLTGVPCRSGYAASKHAMFGFFDSLRVELTGTGVTVTMIAPDFVVSEIHRRAVDGTGRPLGQSPMQESKIMGTEACAEMMVDAIEKRKRLLITSFRGKLARWIKLLSPASVDALAAKAIRDRK